LQNLRLFAVQGEKANAGCAVNLVRRITTTERPGYEPDGDGFVRKVNAEFGTWATALNAREQERKAMANGPGIQDYTRCKHGNALNTLSGCDYCNVEKARDRATATPETLSTRLRRTLSQIDSTMSHLAELKREVEKVLGAL
jgi:hypothetical protein